MRDAVLRTNVKLTPQTRALITFYRFRQTPKVQPATERFVYKASNSTHTLATGEIKDQSRCDRLRDSLIDIHKCFFFLSFKFKRKTQIFVQGNA